MGQLVVRKVEEDVIRALKREALKNGRSAEAEHREILRRHLLTGPKRSLKAHLLSMPDVGEDRDFEVRRPRARRVTL
jgi:antitoxin FitA